MASIFRPSYTRLDPQTGKKVRRRLKKWYIKYRDADGIVQKVPGFTDKQATRALAAELERKAERLKANLADPYEEQRKRPLVDHLDDYQASLLAKGTTEKHANLYATRIRACLDGCKFRFIPDLSASAIQTFLAELRQQGSQGLSIQTSNHYLRAIKAFTRWLVRDRRTLDNPLLHLSGGNVKLDRRHDRRALSAEELQAILAAARNSTAMFRGLAGPDRAMLYAVAMGTGLRASELASLTPGSFDLAATPPVVNVAPAYTKNKQPVTQPLPQDVAEAMHGYLEGRSGNSSVWPGTWSQAAAKMIRVDLEAADIPYAIEGPRGPLYADFHALRHSYITLLANSGVHPKMAQTLARHSSITLTMDRYSHIQLHDQAVALDALPPILPTEHQGGVVQATGTDGKPVAHVPLHSPAGGVSLIGMVGNDRDGTTGASDGAMQGDLVLQGNGGSRDELRGNDKDTSETTENDSVRFYRPPRGTPPVAGVGFEPTLCIF